VDDELKTYLEAKFSEVRAELEGVETRLLSEFWKWGRASDQRIWKGEFSRLSGKWQALRNEPAVDLASPNTKT
jgi:hypothetical protein